MLESYGVECTSDIKLKKIRNPVTRKMTSILNGNRFIYAKPLPEDKPLPRNSYCAGLRCQIFHYGQVSKRSPYCANCWETTHYRLQCENERRCKVCKKRDMSPEIKHVHITQKHKRTLFHSAFMITNYRISFHVSLKCSAILIHTKGECN